MGHYKTSRVFVYNERDSNILLERKLFMTVGEALKQIRLQAGLTQTQMTAGVVSESFYSKVERGVHAIDVQTLVNILSAHHMDVVHFFSLLNYQKSETEPNFELINEISFAQNKKDIKRLNKIKKKIENGGGTAFL